CSRGRDRRTGVSAGGKTSSRRSASPPPSFGPDSCSAGSVRHRGSRMRWRDLRRSTNVRDLRGRRTRAGIPLAIGGRGGGIGVIILLLIAALVGGPEVLNLLTGTESVDYESRGVPQGAPDD